MAYMRPIEDALEAIFDELKLALVAGQENLPAHTSEISGATQHSPS
jgi:hypothetical protein